ncbi:MAG: hydroxymethylpyrimidine/phosphomethylpyrimidine kinase [Bifidobacteriaceae bacterium]|nr:hydroxymethylpyrimidine/phosphomethylpyrimidine kinase [Bifidobacteriaceae bacterium]
MNLSTHIGQGRVSGAVRAPASAITAEPAKAASMSDAVRAAKAFTTRGVEGRVGGHTPFDTVWQGA